MCVYVKKNIIKIKCDLLGPEDYGLSSWIGYSKEKKNQKNNENQRQVFQFLGSLALTSLA